MKYVSSVITFAALCVFAFGWSAQARAGGRGQRGTQPRPITGPWREPRVFAEGVISEAVDWYPSVTADGTLYFGSGRPGGKGAFDIYRSRLVEGKYAEPENLGDAINTRFPDLQPYVAPDQSFLVFASAGRPDETLADGFYYPRGDLYVSRGRDGVWTAAENLGPKVNPVAAESRPGVSPDGEYLFFTSERGFATPPLRKRLTYEELVRGVRSRQNGLGNIYQINIKALGIRR